MSAALLSIKKYILNKKHLLISMFSILALTAGLWHCWNYLLVTCEYTITVDTRCSESACTQITHYLHDTLLKTVFQPQTIATLKSHFTFLKNIEARYVRPGSLHIVLKVANPLICINEHLVMLENGVITQKDIFKEEVLKELPTVLVAEKEKVSSKKFAFHLEQWLTNCSPELFAHYTVQWVDHTHIQLQDKAKPDFYIITHTNKIPSYTILAQCNLIKNNLLAQRTVKNNKEKKDGALIYALKINL